VSNLSNKFETEEIREDFGNVIDYRCNTKKSRRATVILKMPKEESENQSDAKSHPPCDEKERDAFDVFELLQYRHPFRYFFRR
jgi:hypothetical protein